MDDCNRLWVLDNGKIGEEQKCPPKILAFDLKTDKVVVQKEIPNKYAFNSNGNGLLVTPLVKTLGEQCEHITVRLLSFSLIFPFWRSIKTIMIV